MKNVDVRLVSAEIAQGFWDRQDDARIFLHPEVLGTLSSRVDWWQGSWKGEAVCLWPICQAEDGRHVPPDLAAYVGPLWDDALGVGRAHRWWSITSKVQKAMLARLVEQYGTFQFDLPPGTRDVRAVQWFGESELAKNRVAIECRHTALVKRPEEHSVQALSEAFSENRRRDLKGAGRLAYRRSMNVDPEALYLLYLSLLDQKQSREVAKRRKEEVLGLVRLVSAGHGNIVAFTDAHDQVASFALILKSRKTASGLLLASSDRARRDGLQAVVWVQAMSESFAEGAEIFDFVGANSPVGSEDNHRYGAWPEMYFRVRVELS